MGTTNARTVVEIRGMTIDIRSSEVVYIEIGDRTYYVDDSTGEAIMESWPTSSMPRREERHSDLDTIDLDHDLGTRDLTSPFGEED